MSTSATTLIITRRSALVAATLLGLRATAGAARQAGRTDATHRRVPQGVLLEILSAGDSTHAPGTSLSMARITLQPGGATRAQPQVGSVALYVDAGTLEIEVLEGACHIQRAPVDGMWIGHRAMTAGDASLLAAGDQMFHEYAAYTVRNSRDAPATLLASMLTDTGVAVSTWLEPA